MITKILNKKQSSTKFFVYHGAHGRLTYDILDNYRMSHIEIKEP